MNTVPQAKKPFLLPMWTAEVAMLLFSALAIAGIMGWLPFPMAHAPAEAVITKPTTAPAIKKDLPQPTTWTGMRGSMAGPAPVTG
jgi:hypothetical protein